MKKVELTAYGAPEEVARCVDGPDVGDPGPGEVVFDVLAFPINPADVSFCRGSYRLRPSLPATPGAEGLGRVVAIGAGVSELKPGDLVINMQRENWTQRRRVRGEDAIPIPSGLDLAQAAMLRINPPTALLLLDDHVTLAPGDWVIQNVANSAVGRHVIVLAKARGVRTVNVVRRDDVAAELRDLGADVVLKDGPDLADRARAAVGGGPVRLGIDAVSGEATKRIGDCVAEGGVVVSYGSMTGEDPTMSRAAVNMRGVNLTGFNLGRGLAKRTHEQVRAIYADLAMKLRDGVLRAPIDAFYPIEEIRSALIRAQQGGRNGKVLVLPHGPLKGEIGGRMADANHQGLILDQFTRQATVFSTAPAITDEDALRMIVEAARPRAGDTVLDVACGGGIVVCAFAPHLRHASGIDVTPAMLERARALAMEKGVSNVSWRQGDVTALPYDDGSFTIVVTRFAFHHFLEPLAVLREMVRVCAPEGRIVVVDTCASEDPAKAAEFNRLEKLRDPSHARNLTVTELKRLFRTVGLPEPQMTSYELRSEVRSLLARSFPNPGDDLKIVEMFKTSAADDRLGIPVRIDGDKIHYAYPVTILAAQRLTR